MGADKALTYLALSQTLYDIVKIGAGSFPIRWQVLHLHSHLLRENVLLNVVVLVGHAAHGSLLPQLSRLLTTHLPLHIFS